MQDVDNFDLIKDHFLNADEFEFLYHNESLRDHVKQSKTRPRLVKIFAAPEPMISILILSVVVVVDSVVIVVVLVVVVDF